MIFEAVKQGKGVNVYRTGILRRYAGKGFAGWRIRGLFASDKRQYEDYGSKTVTKDFYCVHDSRLFIIPASFNTETV